MPSQRLSLVVGLGNPGAEYAQTRHNAGFMAADEIARKFDIGFDKRKFDTVFGRGRIDQAPVGSFRAVNRTYDGCVGLCGAQRGSGDCSVSVY